MVACLKLSIVTARAFVLCLFSTEKRAPAAKFQRTTQCFRYLKSNLILSDSTGSTICSETLYFVDCESADGRSENYLSSNERYIHKLQNDTNIALLL